MSERATVTRWLWLSFATEDRNLGCACVEATDGEAGAEIARRLGIHPGGECLAVELSMAPSQAGIPVEMLNRLFSVEEWERGGVSQERVEEFPPQARWTVEKEN